MRGNENFGTMNLIHPMYLRTMVDGVFSSKDLPFDNKYVAAAPDNSSSQASFYKDYALREWRGCFTICCCVINAIIVSRVKYEYRILIP